MLKLKDFCYSIEKEKTDVLNYLQTRNLLPDTIKVLADMKPK